MHARGSLILTPDKDENVLITHFYVII